MNQSILIGVDVGGTKTAAAVVDAEGTLYAKVKLPTGKPLLEQSIEQIVSGMEQVLAAASLSARAAVSWDQIASIGVVIPGIYFAETGEAWAPNIWGWDRVPLRSQLESRLRGICGRIIPVALGSDRAAYVLGEQWLGAARGLSDVVFLAVGTGIGAGIITGGQLCHGAGDIAGAVGWFAVDPRKKEIYRRMGCLEAEAAAPAVARRTAEKLALGEDSMIREMVSGELERITAEVVVDAARKNDPLALSVLAETAIYLGMGIANIISILNPQIVVLGGGLMQAGDLLLEPIRREVREWAQPLAAEQARIELAQLGEDAGAVGAARLALMRDARWIRDA